MDKYPEITGTVIMNMVLSLIFYGIAVLLFCNKHYDLAACAGIAAINLRQASDHEEIKNLLKGRTK